MGRREVGGGRWGRWRREEGGEEGGGEGGGEGEEWMEGPG